MPYFLAFSISLCLVLYFKGITVAYPLNSGIENASKLAPVLAEVSSTDCSATNCSLEMSSGDAEKLKALVFDDKALAIFLIVTLSNSTEVDVSMDQSSKIVPLDIQMKEKWSWLRNKRGRFLATLPYDFDILSLTILTREAYDMNLKLKASPLMCYSNISLGCVRQLVAFTVINATKALGNVCLRSQERAMGLNGYCCCHQLRNGTVLCNMPIEDNQWIKIALRFLWALSIGLGIFAPLLLKYLPKEFKRGPRIRVKTPPARSNSEVNLMGSQTSFESVTQSFRQVLMAMDDGMIDVLRTRTESILWSRLSRCVFVIVLCSLPVLQGMLYAYLKKAEVGISTGKLLGVGDAFITLIEPVGQFALSVSFFFCVLLICIAIAIPRTLSELARRLSGRHDERTFLGFKKPYDLIGNSDKRGFQLMYEIMVFHLNCVMKLSFWKFVLLVITFPLQKLCGVDMFGDGDDINVPEERAENDESPPNFCSKICQGVLLLLIFPPWALTIATAFVLYILPVTYVAFRIWKMLFRVEIESQCCQAIPGFVKITAFPVLYILFIVFCMLVEASYFMLAVTLTINIMFLGSVLGFTIMGFLFYIHVYLPHIVLGTWVLVYLLRGINKYYAQFTRLKSMVFDECEKHDNELRAEASIRETFSGPIAAERKLTASVSSISRSKSISFLVTPDEYGIPSIPVELFLMASCQLMPFRRTILAKLLKVLALGSYLTVIFLFVMSLMQFEAASTVVQGLALLLLGGLPLLAIKKPGHITQVEEIKARYHIKELIKEFTKRSA